jgi:GTP cyclohydrolase I
MATEEQRFLIDVGMSGLHFPIRACSRDNPDGQSTVAEISVSARIWKNFEASWIDKFIQIAHRHRETLGPASLRSHIMDYYKEFRAASVRLEYQYPFFHEKITPFSKEKCLVRYRCLYSATIDSMEKGVKLIQRIEAPVLTTYPGSTPETEGGLFAQLSVVDCEVETSNGGCLTEDLIDIIDRNALMPVYSFLTPEDQAEIIRKVHSDKKTSVVMTDSIKEELRRHPAVRWYRIRTNNHGMLHSYSTFVATEKTSWAPMAV